MTLTSFARRELERVQNNGHAVHLDRVVHIVHDRLVHGLDHVVHERVVRF